MRRREIKKVWIVMKLLLKQGAVSKHQQMDIENVDRGIRETMGLLTNETVPFDQIIVKREKLEQNVELKEVFTMFWLVLTPHINDGVLSKEGYLKFNILMQRALLGTLKEDEHMKFAEDDYTHDINAYGPMNETAFYDVMIEVIETWSEMLNPKFYAAFAWALLGSIVNITSRPPKFKPLKHVECITRDILTKFSTEKKNRANVKLHTEWLSSSSMRPEVQKRLLERRHAQTLNRDKTDMLELVNREIEHFEHSDEESSVASMSTKVTHRSVAMMHDDTFDGDDMTPRGATTGNAEDDLSVDSSLLKRLHSGVVLEKPQSPESIIPPVSILASQEGSQVFDVNFSLHEGSVPSVISNNLSHNGGSVPSIKSISFNPPALNTSRNSVDTYNSRGSRGSRLQDGSARSSRASRAKSSRSATSQQSSHLGVNINSFDVSLNDWIDHAQSFLASEYANVASARMRGDVSVSTTSSAVMMRIDGLKNPNSPFPSTLWNPRRALKQYKSYTLPPELRVPRRGKIPPRKDEIVPLGEAMECHEKKSKKTKRILDKIATVIERNSSVETCLDTGVVSDEWLTTVPMRKPLGTVLADIRHSHTLRKQVSQEHIPKSPPRARIDSSSSPDTDDNFFLTGQGTANSSITSASNIKVDDAVVVPALTISTMNAPLQPIRVPSLEQAESPIYKTYSRMNQSTSALQYPSPGPWVPQGGFAVMLSDKKHKLLNWREQRDVLRNYPVDNTMHRTILKRQDVVRHALESYLSATSEPSLATLKIG